MQRNSGLRPSMGSMADSSALAALQSENARLIALLDAHGIEWRLPQSTAVVAREPETAKLSTAAKIALFRRLFRVLHIDDVVKDNAAI